MERWLIRVFGLTFFALGGRGAKLSGELSDRVMADRDVIPIEPGRRSGKPCIRGLRITVMDVWEYWAAGMTEAEILSDFAEWEERDIRACLQFAGGVGVGVAKLLLDENLSVKLTVEWRDVF